MYHPFFLLPLASLLIYSTSYIHTSESSRKEYLQLLEQHPSLVQPSGKASLGEIEIVLDEHHMASIEKHTGREVGVVARDRYWIWINDACIFPSGREGVYGRILWMSSLDGPAGVIVLPLTQDGKIVLNCNFRHATRSWEIELPRGARNLGETLENAAKRETLEETGMVVDDLILLGEIPTDTGLTPTTAPIFLATVMNQQQPEQEDSEAIEEILFLSIDEVKQAFIRGYHTCSIKGQEQHVLFRDPFLAYALLLYELKQATF